MLIFDILLVKIFSAFQLQQSFAEMYFMFSPDTLQEMENTAQHFHLLAST